MSPLLRTLTLSALALGFAACADGSRLVEPLGDAGSDGAVAPDLVAAPVDLCCGQADATPPPDLLPAVDLGSGPDFVASEDQAPPADLALARDAAIVDLGSPADLVATSDPALIVDLPPGADLAASSDLASRSDLALGRDLAAAPDLAPTCQPGHYSGVVTANVMGLALMGPIELDVGAPANGLLPVTGTIRGAAPGATAMSDVQGTLDCNARRFAGTLKNGSVTAMGITLALSGSLAADYRLAPPGFSNGSVTLLAPAMGQGSWSAARK